MVEDNAMSGIVKIDVPEIEFKGDDPLHRAALQLAAQRSVQLGEAMLLLAEARAVLDVLSEQLDAAPGAMVCDVRRRVHQALTALDKQERADRDVYLALAETQRKH